MTSTDIIDMPIAERLKLMEMLWDSLCGQSGATIASPAWHGEVLEARLRRLAAGKESVTPWNEAKARIRSQAKAV